MSLSKFPNKSIFPLLFFISFILNGALLYKVWSVTKEYEAFKDDPKAIVQESNKDLTLKVSELVKLPENEDPTVATVTDVSSLQGQPFFEKAQNGDKVLIYTNSQQAYLYRPSEHKLINVSSISIDNSDAEQAVAGESDQAIVRVAIYNSTNNESFIDSVKNKLSDVPSGTVFDVVDAGTAASEYADVIVSDISGVYPNGVSEISNALNAKVVPIPDGEVYPQADILIIIGSNFSN